MITSTRFLCGLFLKSTNLFAEFHIYLMGPSISFHSRVWLLRPLLCSIMQFKLCPRFKIQKNNCLSIWFWYVLRIMSTRYCHCTATWERQDRYDRRMRNGRLPNSSTSALHLRPTVNGSHQATDESSDMFWDREVIVPQEPWVPSDVFSSSSTNGDGGDCGCEGVQLCRIDPYGHYRDPDCPKCTAVAIGEAGEAHWQLLERDIPQASSSSRRQGKWTKISLSFHFPKVSTNLYAKLAGGRTPAKP